MTTKILSNSETAILSRVIQPDEATFSPEAARSLLTLRFRQPDLDRMNALAAKAREGTISPQDDEELDNYIKVGHLIGLLQSKPRKSLHHAGIPA